jgi:hypothetical protein
MAGWNRVGLIFVALACIAAGPPPEDQRLVPGGRAGFVSDGADGCWLWASGLRAGAEGLTASWTGSCPDGPAEGEGRGEVHWREGGTPRAMIYEGRLLRGKSEGRGRLTIMSGKDVVAIQDGEFRDDFFVSGRMELPGAGAVYEGGWLLAHPNGRGRLTINGRVLEGDWRNGCLRLPRGWFAFTRPARECEGTDT